LIPQCAPELAGTVCRVVGKLLHTPTVRIQQLASAAGCKAYADALRGLFELDPRATAAITTPLSRRVVGRATLLAVVTKMPHTFHYPVVSTPASVRLQRGILHRRAHR
jgi:hypothetical protein